MIRNIDDINKKLSDNEKNYISVTDKDYFEKVYKIASEIKENRNEKPIVLLSGPSGSGKTTTAMLIEKLLDSWKCETHTLSLDNYFKPLTTEEQLLLKDHKMDLESPQRMDEAFLNDQIKKMLDCESADIPKFSFKQNVREFSGWTLKRKPGEIVIFEGIHALNQNVIKVNSDHAIRIYISVRTRVEYGDGEILQPSFVRLMRRMIRDKQFRNRSIEQTLSMYDSVQNGETKYILPHKNNCTFDINTFINYEINAYKPFLLNELQNLPENETAKKLVDVLQKADSLTKDKVPQSSLIREFIGEGQFEY